MSQSIQDLSHIHRFVPSAGGARTPLLMLHGTGGDENDLIGLGAALRPDAPLLSPRGRVLENGMPRFFRRLSEGVFDEADVALRAGELARFVEEARGAYGLGAPIAVGFSNGANIAAALLMLEPGLLAGAVLIRPMTPLAKPPAFDLGGRPVLMLSGALDPIVPSADAERLAAVLQAGGAQVRHDVLPAGHNLSQMDLTLAHRWLQEVAA